MASTDRVGGPGSSHQNREQPARSAPTGHKHHGPPPDPKLSPGAPTSGSGSHVSGGGGERDRHHAHGRDEP